MLGSHALARAVKKNENHRLASVGAMLHEHATMSEGELPIAGKESIEETSDLPTIFLRT